MSGRFSSDVYARRVSAAANGAAAAGLAGLIITPGYDLRYLIGSRAQTFERLTALVIPAAGGQERSDSGITNRTPTVVLPRMELAALRESAVDDLGLTVCDWVDGNNPYRLVADALGGVLPHDAPCGQALHEAVRGHRIRAAQTQALRSA